MIFTTKAEYGVRLLVRLGQSDELQPVSLKTVADSERLPLAYLERIVALLRKAGLVESTRGAHGGYRLALPPDQIKMDAVISALEGAIAPMSCFVDDSGGEKVLCSHLDQQIGGSSPCGTKLLWMRVQDGVNTALKNTTLAELVKFETAETAVK